MSMVDECIMKMWYIYTMEYYSAIKKNEIMPIIAMWINLEMVLLSEKSQAEKDKYHIISLICGSLQMVTAAMKLKDTYSLEGKL